MNYLQPFAELCTENFRWNVWIDAAYLGNFAQPYNPDKKEKKKTRGRLGNPKIH